MHTIKESALNTTPPTIWHVGYWLNTQVSAGSFRNDWHTVESFPRKYEAEAYCSFLNGGTHPRKLAAEGISA